MKQIFLLGPLYPGEAFFEAERQIKNRLIQENREDISILNPKTYRPLLYCETDVRRYERNAVQELAASDGIGLIQGWQRDPRCIFISALAGRLKIPAVYIQPPVAPEDIDGFYEQQFYSDIPRYYEQRITALERKGVENSENIALLETVHRYLDPEGFEYI
ncbi:MAG: hypothetical protein LBC31_11780 [Treponema sp.]|jgi:hypothetical protein|nr:hypothetical protein [Treponema sp.]